MIKGYRIKKTLTQNNISTTTNYFLDGDKVLKETKSDGTEIKYFYDVDNTVTGFSYNNNIYLYVRNLQEDITKIVDESGNEVVEYTYDAWGNIINTVDNTEELNLAEINPYRYRGYRYDEKIKYYYLNSRYYNPEMGKFINMDGIIGQIGNILGHNLYAYTENNPVMSIDPSGYCLADAIYGFFGDPKVRGCGTGGGFGQDNYSVSPVRDTTSRNDTPIVEEVYNDAMNGEVKLYYFSYNDLVSMVGSVIDMGPNVVAAVFVAKTSYMILIPKLNIVYVALASISAYEIGVKVTSAISQRKGLGLYYNFETVGPVPLPLLPELKVE